VQRILKERPSAMVKLLAVWEPMLITDWGRPLTLVLGRLPDARVRQFWDGTHLVARQIRADARPPQPEPECCDDSGILWDMVAVYPKGAVWGDRLPPAVFVNGPVIDIEPSLRGKVAELLAGT
jgi:hypothetical protein